MNNFPCCALCRGSSPYFFCKDKRKSVLQPGCKCHTAQEKSALKHDAYRGYSDPTPRAALINIYGGKK